MQVAESVLYFILAGLCEIGGGYLVWLWLREGASIWFGVFGAVILVLYELFRHYNQLILDGFTLLMVEFL